MTIKLHGQALIGRQVLDNQLDIRGETKKLVDYARCAGKQVALPSEFISLFGDFNELAIRRPTHSTHEGIEQTKPRDMRPVLSTNAKSPNQSLRGFRTSLSRRFRGLRSDHRQPGMYGPPLCCKPKMRVTGWSAQMYSAFGGVEAPGHDGMRCALLPFSNTVLKRLLPGSGFGSAGSDRCAISFSPADLAGFLVRSSRWVADVGIALVISKPVVRQASSAGQSC
jgi:hypothetical protein